MKYYRMKAKMIFEKEVLVPYDDAECVSDAKEIVDDAVEYCEISLLNEEAYFVVDFIGNEEFEDVSETGYQVVRKVD